SRRSPHPHGAAPAGSGAAPRRCGNRRAGRSRASAGRGDRRTRARPARGTGYRGPPRQGPAAGPCRWWHGRCPRRRTATGRARRWTDASSFGSLDVAGPDELPEQAVHLLGTVLVGVLGEDARPRPLADGPGPFRRQGGERLGDVTPVTGDEHLLTLLQEEVESLPCIGDEAGARPRRLEHPGRRREAVL